MKRKAALVVDVMSVLDNIISTKLGFNFSSHVSLDDFLYQGIRDANELYDVIDTCLDDEGVFNSDIETPYKALDYIRINDPALNETIQLARQQNVQLYEINTVALACIHDASRRKKIWQDEYERVIRILKFLCNEIYLAEVKDEIEKEISKRAADILLDLNINVDTCEEYRLFSQEDKDIIKRIISEH